MSTETPASQQVIDSPCSNCGGIRTHIVLRKSEKRVEAENGDVWWHDDYYLLQCGGCETHSFRHESTFSEDYYGNGWETKVLVFPPLPKRKALEELELPTRVERMYGETIDAFNSNLFLLCGIGLRALVEGICDGLGVKDGPASNPSTKKPRNNGIDGKINGLVEKGFATQEEAKALHENRFMGNEAAHELTRPTEVEVNYAIDIVEHLLRRTYSTAQTISEKAAEIARIRDSRKVPVVEDDDDI